MEIRHHDGQKSWVPSNPQVEDLKGKVRFGENYAMVYEPISFVNNLSEYEEIHRRAKEIRGENVHEFQLLLGTSYQFIAHLSKSRLPGGEIWVCCTNLLSFMSVKQAQQI